MEGKIATTESPGEMMEIYQALVESVRDGIFIVQDRKFAFINKAFALLSGYSREELLGKDFLELFPPERRQALLERYQERIAGRGTDGEYEMVMPTRDGNGRVLLWISAERVFFRGKPASMGFVRDITLRKETENRLRVVEERFRNLAEMLPEVVYELDLEGNFTFVNQKASDYFGYDLEDFPGRLGFLDIIAPGDRIRAATNMFRIIHGEDLGLNEYRALRKDGTTFPVVIRSMPLPAKEGGPGVRGFIMDDSKGEEAREALRKSERNYRELVHTANSIIIRLDRQGRITFVNEYAQSFFGYREEELLGKHPLGTIVPEDGALPALIGRIINDLAAKSEKYKSQVNENITSSGKRVWIAWANKAIFDEEGKLAEILCVGNDITERKQAEEAERKRTENIRRLQAAVLEMARSGAVVSGKMEEAFHAITETTARALRVERSSIWLLDEERGELECADFYDAPRGRHSSGRRLKAGDFKEYFDSLKNAVAIDVADSAHDHRAFELRERIPCRMKATSLLDTAIRVSGKTVGILCIETFSPRSWTEDESFFARDAADQAAKVFAVVERERAKEKLNESDRRFLETNRLLPQTVFEMDMDGRFTFLSDRLFGYSEKDLEQGLFAAEFVVQEERDRVIRDIARFAEGEGEKFYEFTGVRKDGSSFPMAIYPAAIVRNGRIEGVRGIAIDTTDQKRAQAEKQDLERLLRQSQKMEAIGTLASGIAHDFNNILGAIMAYTELGLYSASMEPKTRSHLNQVLAAAKRARDLVRQILTFSRQTEPERKPLQPAPVIKEALKLLGASLPSSLTIRAKIPSDLDMVLADPAQIQQVLLNLCANAHHAMKEGGGELTVRMEEVVVDREDPLCEQGLRPGPCICISVRDTGHGMDAETQERIFEPYFTTKEKGEGTGLGLAVVHGIVRSHKGAITVASKPGEGTVFRVFLPALAARQDEDQPLEPPEIEGGGERILFVEDEKALLESVRELLEDLGYRVSARVSPFEALELLKGDPEGFDLVITDMTMPGMTGDEFSKRVLRLRPDMPIILCTGFSELIDEAKKLGLKHFLTKPVSIANLARSIRDAFRDRACLIPSEPEAGHPLAPGKEIGSKA